MSDAATRNAFQKFDAMVCKKWAAVLDGFNEENYRQLESLKNTWAEMDYLFPVIDDEEDEEPAKRRGGQKRFVFYTLFCGNTSH
jgi:condensin complex subunit 3